MNALSSSFFEYVIVPDLSFFKCDNCDVRVTVETRKLCNSLEGDSQCHHEFFFGMRFLFNFLKTFQPRTAQLMLFCSCVWQALRAHQSLQKMSSTTASSKITTDLEREGGLEENSMTVYVKTISGKTISIKCDKQQKADTVSKKIVEMKTSIPQGVTYLVHQGKVLNDKKTTEENNLGAEATIEMSLRLLGEMEDNDMMESLESEDEREDYE